MDHTFYLKRLMKPMCRGYANIFARLIGSSIPPTQNVSQHVYAIYIILVVNWRTMDIETRRKLYINDTNEHPFTHTDIIPNYYHKNAIISRRHNSN